MPPPTVQELIDAITRHAPRLNPRIVRADPVPGKDYINYIVDCGNNIKFNFGANLNFFRGKVLVDSLKHVPLLGPKDVDKFVEKCLSSLSQTLGKVPQVKDLALRYLGQMEQVRKTRDETMIQLYYPKFEVWITANRAYFIGRKSMRVMQAEPFSNEAELEKAFGVFKASAEMIDELEK